jgi:hypothetical protein
MTVAFRTIALVLTLLVMIGSIDVQESSAAPLDACVLLTRADVEGVVGVGVGEGEAQKSQIDGHVTCRYQALDDSAGPREVTFDVYQPETISLVKEGLYPSLASYFQRQRELMAKQAIAVIDVPGLGDAACWERRTLHVLKGDVYMVIRVMIGGVSAPTEEELDKLIGPRTLEMSKALAQKALARL